MEYILLVPAIFAILITYWSIRVFGSLVNPVALFSIGLAIPSFFVVVVDVLTKFVEIEFPIELNYDSPSFFPVSLAYVLAILTFFLPWMLLSKKIRAAQIIAKAFQPISERNYLRSGIFIFTAFVLIIITIVGFNVGGIPLFGMIAGTIDVRDSDQSATGLPLGMLSLINLSIMVTLLWFVSYLFDSKSNWRDWKKYLFFIALYLPVFFWNGKRQSLLFFLVIFIFKYILEWNENAIFKQKVASPRLIMISSLIILLTTFIMVDAIRYQGVGANPIILIGYLTWPARNIMSIYEHLGFGSAGTMLGNMNMVLTELLPARLGGKDQVEMIGTLLFEPTSPSGFLAYWWFDGGLIYSLFGTLIFSCLSIYIYTKRLISPSWGRIYLLTLWCCISSGIYNHFIALNFYWLPLFFFAIEGKIRTYKKLISH